jgi:hypothetical protein
MTTSAATALAEAARSIEAEARHHKREEAAHRRRARALQRRLTEIRAECERLGIDLKITQAPAKES